MCFSFLRKFSNSKWSLITKGAFGFGISGIILTFFGGSDRTQSFVKRASRNSVLAKTLFSPHTLGLKITNQKMCIGRSRYGYKSSGTWNEEGRFCEIKEKYGIGERNPHSPWERKKTIDRRVQKTRDTITKIKKDIGEVRELLEKLEKAIEDSKTKKRRS